MIICKYQKTGAAAYIPHLDILRGFCMAIRRAGLEVAYSEGFNPHMVLYFTQPLPLGTESLCEYMVAASNENPEIFMCRLNENLSDNLRILKAARVENNPNVANLADSALYSIKGIPFGEKDLQYILSGSVYNISYSGKKGETVKDVRPLIKGLKAEDGQILAHLLSGNVNLRPDRLFANEKFKDNFCKKDMDICKKIMYTVVEGEDVDIDALFFDAQNKI